MSNKTFIIPTLYYKNPAKAVKWLETAFGFRQQMFHESEDGKVVHGQLVRGDNMIMIGLYPNSSIWGQCLIHPSEANGSVTQGNFCILKEDEIDAHYQASMSQGAEILDPLKDQPYGGKNYTCKDLEGYLWSFGTYNPWA